MHVIGVLDDDSDPDGDELRVLSVSAANPGTAEVNSDGTISYYPVPGWVGVDRFTYLLADSAGSTDTVPVEVTMTEATREVAIARSGELGTEALPFDSPVGDVVIGDGYAPGLSEGMALMADAFFQSLGAMSLPLIFLALAMLMVFAFGGFSEVPLLIAATRRRLWSAVLRHREELLQVHEEADPESGVIYTYEPTARGIKSIDKSVTKHGVVWTPVASPAGDGWVRAAFLTETVSFEDFQSDHRPVQLVHELTRVLDEGGDLAPLVAERGLLVALGGNAHLIAPERIARLRSGITDPAAPAEESQFEALVAQPLRSALLDNAQLNPQTKHSQSALIPTEAWNFPYLAIHAPGHTSWLIHFEYVHGRPTIVGLVIDE